MQLNRAINGILKYIEREMFPKMNSWQQLGMGVVVGRMARDTKSIKELGIVKLLNVVDEHDNVDVEGLKKDVMQQMNRLEKLELDIPYIGKFTFGKSDIEQLFNTIMEA